MRLRALVPTVVAALLLGVAAGPGVADETGFTVRGQVVDTAGRPVEYTSILVVELGDDVAQTVTGPDGRFALAGLSARSYRIKASTNDSRLARSGATTATVDVIDRDVSDVRLTVRRNGNIVVKAIDASGNPVRAVYPVAKRGSTSHQTYWTEVMYSTDGMTVREQQERDSHSVMTNLPDGTYSVSSAELADPNRYSVRVAPRSVTVQDGSSPIVTVTLTRKKRAVFTGRVLTSKGKSLAGAVVRPYSPGDRESARYDNTCRPAKARSDKKGAYTFSCVDTTTARAVITDPKWKHVARAVSSRGTPGATTPIRAVKLKRSATVEARIVTSSGAKLPGGGFLDPYVKRGKKFVRAERVAPVLAYSGTSKTSRVRGLPAGTYRFCYAEGDGPGVKRPHRDRCPKKTYKIRAGSTRTLPTVRLRR